MIDKAGDARIMDFGIARSLKEKGKQYRRALFRVDPRWDSLRGNPRFEKLLKENGK